MPAPRPKRLEEERGDEAESEALLIFGSMYSSLLRALELLAGGLER